MMIPHEGIALNEQGTRPEKYAIRAAVEMPEWRDLP
jgi:hypothetical protein